MDPESESLKMDTVISISEASTKFQISNEQLHTGILSGKIPAVIYNGVTLVSERYLMTDLPRNERPEYLKYAHLRGIGIGMREAGRKYGVNNVTLFGWVKNGLVAVLGKQGKQKVLIDEADVAYCAEIHSQNAGQGKRVFNPDGTPYQKKK